ncbi:3-hydroxy-3-methylglutaryl-coenzyme A reductase-like [Onthophagus taurus]|uniref:3-hydroxy-3-methylglutaryl-coenzyme A reductase-like n=1 Tax=Onthophagus taurus TaxID=166361 RepID=UPI000C1FEB21|nr:3-hydroxy-3-methylglutaryl-coenzyme A reductase-like [Onthophagus taurus]XP_022901117.1 3-hydroxy-3-methylglutaryl-coenzyme A reductase-like [Onthophagus taurus]
MTSTFFRKHGEFCATHPWEVIVAIFTLTACMLTMDKGQWPKPVRTCPGCPNDGEYNPADVILMTAIRCLAVLYAYYQLRHLNTLGSKCILGIAGVFTVFSSFVFISTVINFLRNDVNDLKDALFFFLLLIDLSKAALLAEFALSAANQEEVKNNIATGMSVLGPTITLDTIVVTLVIGVGTLSGAHRWEVLSYFACLSVIVNYIVFMTFYPACLSLISELSNLRINYRSIISLALKAEDHKSNPVVQRVKIIMSVGLMCVHVHSRLPFREDLLGGNNPRAVEHFVSNNTEDTALHSYIMKWLTLSADHIVILILLLALVVKFIFFENEEEFQQIRSQLSQSGEQFLLNQKKTAREERTSILRNRFKSGMPFFISDDSTTTEDREVQTEFPYIDSSDVEVKPSKPKDPRPLDECLTIYKSEWGASTLSDEEVIRLVKNKTIAPYQLEKAVNNPERGVGIRRKIFGENGKFDEALINLPYKDYDYSKVMGACCENVIGYLPVPIGIVGPLKLDGKLMYVPMATTEGCLVASTNRGCRALIQNGVTSRIVKDGMTRAPVVRFPTLAQASEAMAWMENPDNFTKIKEHFDSSSRYARLTRLHINIAGRQLFIRFEAKTGDAMGMNMVSKGTEQSLRFVQNSYPEMEILSLSGNFCTDKKPAAVNWIEGRGKSVVCEAIVPAAVISTVLKTSVKTLVDVNISKNMVGSAMAGSIGGFNAHSANVVTAIYIATGQDPAQNVGSSNCITLMEPCGETGEDLYISCTMPSIEIGTVGGGTILAPQAACLDILNVKGANIANPGENAKQLARIVCATVLAGELSLMSALAAGHLVKSHLKHNRSSTTMSGDVATGKSLFIAPCKDNV